MGSTQPPIHWVPMFIPGGKAAGGGERGEFNAEVKNDAAALLLPLDAFLAWTGKTSPLPAVVALFA